MRRVHFYIPKQQQSSDSISDKVSTFLQGLKSLNESLFSDWYQQGWSKKEAQSQKVELDKSHLLEIVNKSWDKKFPELGTKFTFWTGKDNDLLNSTVTFSLGKVTKNVNLTNIITLQIPDQINVSDIGENEIQSIISLLKEVWGNQDFEVIQ